ncbi:MAG: LamG domain-containing protein [Verrucomicrobiota bacterium]
MLGEVDTFSLAPTHEIYAHMNVNYLRLPAFPSKTNWSSVVDCVKAGDFFTTTGEILIHTWNATTTGVTATVEWYCPPAFAEITWGDANGVHKFKQSLATAQQFQTQQLVIPANLSSANWVRLEIWDVARNGAFTQLHWFNSPAEPAVIAGKTVSFTLINADTDAIVPGYDPIPASATLNKALLPQNLTIRANISPFFMDSVTLQLDGVDVTRTQWPYSLAPCTTGPGIGDSPTYDYAASALSVGNHTLTATPQRGTNVGESLTLNFSVINTAPLSTNFVMDGAVDSSHYQIAAGLGLYAAVRGNLLYVAAPATDANDQFILVSTNPSPLGVAPWNKAGQVAFNINAHPYLAQNGNTRAVTWNNAGGAQCPAMVVTGFMEGSLDLVQNFGSAPKTIYLALARYAAGTGGALVAGNQIPAGNGNGTIEASEFLAVPVANLRDETLDGVPDVLEPNVAFSASFSNNPGTFIVRWPTIPSYSYRVDATDNLTQSFQPLSQPILAGPGEFSLSYTDTPPAELTHRFYHACRLGMADPLLAQFKFDGDVSNNGPVGLTATANALAYNSDSKQGGQAGDFNGVSSSVTTSGNSVSGSFSVAFWLQTGSAGVGNAGDQWYNGTGLVDADTPGLSTDWGIALTGNAIAFGIGGGGAGANLTITSPAITDNNWHHVLVTWEQSTRQMRIYLDGQNVATGVSNSGEVRTGASALVIGRNATANRFYNGLVDDVQIYNRALNGADATFLLGFPGQTLH